MTSKELQERLNKAQEKLAKKEALVKKYEAKAEKIRKQIIAKGWSLEAGKYQKHNAEGSPDTEEAYDCYWTFCDLDDAEENIKNTIKAIEEQKLIVERWAEKVVVARAKERVIDSEYPKEFKELKTNLVEEWTRYDLNRKASLRAKYNELGYKEFMKQYKWAGYDFMRKTEEEIRKDNNRTADALILNLWNRVNEKVGDPTDYDLHLENGNSIEGIALNGTVVGTKGTARVESILAGGYNIQRLHIRVLVK